MITFGATITGTAQTGLTSPTYITSVDTAPDVNGKQVAITALGGTQTGVLLHTLSSPFTLAFWKPKVAKLLGRANQITGQINDVPTNTYKLVTRKGVLVAAGQVPRVLIVTTSIEVPAGAETYDAPNVRAALSAHFGQLNSNSAGIGDTVNNNVF